MCLNVVCLITQRSDTELLPAAAITALALHPRPSTDGIRGAGRVSDRRGRMRIRWCNAYSLGRPRIDGYRCPMDELERMPAAPPRSAPVRRRLRPRGRIIPWAVASAVWLLATVVCTPVAAWLVSGTLKASRGGADPQVAVLRVTEAFDQWAGDDLGGVLPYLCPEEARSLKQRLGGLRKELLQAPGNHWVKTANLTTAARGDNAATVSVTVIVYADVSDSLGETATVREGLPWTFQTRRFGGRESGWKVCDFQSHQFCGEYLKC
jgi:hypothetical protein